MANLFVPQGYDEVLDHCLVEEMARTLNADEAFRACQSRIMSNRAVMLQLGNSFVNQMLKPAIRSVGTNKYHVYAMLFGTEEQRDLYGTYFTRDTEYYLDWYSERPWLYHHGLHPMLADEKISRIGTWRSAGIDDQGIFMEGELDRRHKYVEQIDALIDLEALYPSTGALSYVVKIDEDGFVREWPIVETSSTVSPGEWRAGPVQPGALRAIGIMSQGNLSTGGTYTMPDFREKINARLVALGLRAADDDEGAGVNLSKGDNSESEESVGLETQESDAQPEEGAEDVEGTETEENAVEESEIEALRAEVQHLIEAVRSIDAYITLWASDLPELQRDIQSLQQLVLMDAEDDTRRAFRQVTDPEWYGQLFSVRSKVEGVEEESDPEGVRALNSQRNTTSDPAATNTGLGVFDQIKR